MSEPRISAQLIVYAGRQAKDLAGVIGELAQIGYAGAEIGANFADEDWGQVKGVFDDKGMVISGLHAGYAAVANPEWGPKAIDACKAMGVSYILSSGVAPGEGIEPYLRCAEPFNAFGAKCKENGITFCYHNHGWEFESFDGVKGIHKLCEVTDPEVVKLNVDVYWVTVGGENPAEFIERYSNRVGYYHFKDGPYTPTGSVAPKPYEFTELGCGTVDLAGALAAARKFSPSWIVYEQDRTALEPKEACRISFEHLKSLGL